MSDNITNATNSTYLDKEGLKRVIKNIKDTYARIDTLEHKEQDLYDYIDEKNQRAIDEESRIDTRAQRAEASLDEKIDAEELRATQAEEYLDDKIDTEKSRALQAEETLDDRIDTEISRASTAEFDISGRVTTVSNRVTDLEVGKVNDIIISGQSVVDPVTRIADIAISHYTGASIQVYNDYSEMDSIPAIDRQNDKLYVTRDDGVIYQWFDNAWREAGKYNVLLVEELPEEGDPQVLYIKESDHSINIFVGGENPDTRWQEISGQDKELRTEVAQFKDEFDSHTHTWLSIENKPEEFFPSAHTHDDRYYTQEQIDAMMQDGPVSHEELQEHVNSSNPHPEFKTVIDGLLDTKASNSMVMTHINNTSNPHGVTKEQVGLGNVDNTSDLDKPISLAVQAALVDKASNEMVLEGLAGKINATDVIDNLYTHQSEKPLSAKQGTVLDEKIQNLDTKVESLGAAITFKGTVDSREDLNMILNPSTGDAYQINSGTESEDDGTMYAWDGTSWIEIVGAATDLSSLIATDAEVHSIIDEYV